MQTPFEYIEVAENDGENRFWWEEEILSILRKQKKTQKA